MESFPSRSSRRGRAEEINVPSSSPPPHDALPVEQEEHHTLLLPDESSKSGRAHRRKFASQKAHAILVQLQEGSLNLVFGDESLWYIRFLSWYQSTFVSPVTPVDCNALAVRQAFMFVTTLFSIIIVSLLASIANVIRARIADEILIPYGTLVGLVIAGAGYGYCRWRRQVTDGTIIVLLLVMYAMIITSEVLRPSYSGGSVLMASYVFPSLFILKSFYWLMFLIIATFLATLVLDGVQLLGDGSGSFETAGQRNIIGGVTYAVILVSCLLELMMMNVVFSNAWEGASQTTQLIEQLAAKLVTYNTDGAAKLIAAHRKFIPPRLVRCFESLIRRLTAFRPFLPTSILLTDIGAETVPPTESKPTNVRDRPIDVSDTRASGSQYGDKFGHSVVTRAPTVQTLNLVGVLAVFDGEEFVKRPSTLRVCNSMVHSFGGVIEFMTFDRMLVTFGRPGSACPIAHADLSGLEFALALGSELCSSISGQTPPQVLLHRGNAWSVVTGGGQRKWPFLGGELLDTLALLSHASVALDSTCLTSSSFGEKFDQHSCPIDVVTSVKLPHEVHQIQDLCVVFELFEPCGPSLTPQEDALVQTQLLMKEAFFHLARGYGEDALVILQSIVHPSRHVQRLTRDIIAVNKSSRRRKVYALRELFWGASGVAPRRCFVNRSQADMSGSASRPTTAAAFSTSRHAVSSTSRAVSASKSNFDRVAQQLAERNRALMGTQETEAVDTVTFFALGDDEGSPPANLPATEEAEPSALFEMFLSPATNEGDIATFIVDNRGRRWQRANRSYGSGAFSNVFSAMGEYGNLVAVKCVDLESRVISASAEELSHEIETLSSLRHENIVGYIGDCLEGQYFYIFMESMPGGSLATLLQRFGRLPRGAVASYARDALRGLEYLHANDVVHCDIKPANILIGGRGRCKLSDFGSAMNCHLHQNRMVQHSPATASSSETAFGPLQDTPANDEQLTVRGTAGYMSPEACRGTVESASDVWSLGLTVYELLVGELPWGKELGNEAKFIARLGKDEELFPDISALRGDEEAHDFVRQCVHRDAPHRLTVSRLLRHSFLRSLTASILETSTSTSSLPSA